MGVDDLPVFSWTAQPDASRYRLIVKRNQQRKFVMDLYPERICTAEGVCTADAALLPGFNHLKAGKHYSWQVIAFTPAGKLRMPQARFEVKDSRVICDGPSTEQATCIAPPATATRTRTSTPPPQPTNPPQPTATKTKTKTPTKTPSKTPTRTPTSSHCTSILGSRGQDPRANPCTDTPTPIRTSTPTRTPTWTPLPPTATPVEVITVRQKAITLAVFSEAGGLLDADRQIVIFVIQNRGLFPNNYLPIEQALGTSQIAGGVLDGFTGDRPTQINSAYDWYPLQPQYALAFQKADLTVKNFLANPPSDFTQGAIQFSHAASSVYAQQIVQQISDCGQSAIEDIIRGYGINPIVNGSTMHVGSFNPSVYINMNYTLPSGPSGAPHC